MRLSPLEKRLLSIALLGFFVLLGIVLETSGERTVVERPPETEEKGRTLKTVNFPIDINSATYEELVALPGIGPVKAKAIVEYREKNGPFRSPKDILEVPGIGEKTLEGILDFIEIDAEGESASDGETEKRINVNTASLDELIELPGIGEVKARRIIQNRPYEKPEDLLRVPGIGKKTLEKIKELITF